jgi:GrpB-like predicted nucleotidyltransferase (UPF0157 family)
METLEEKIARVLKDEIEIVPWDPRWPSMFEEERLHLSACLPCDLIGRIEHFGSTSVPGLPAKPVIDMLVEVSSLEETKRSIVPVLEAREYDYFWRPLGDEMRPPFYAWFIKRGAGGRRTHHIHMAEADSPLWDGLLFRDRLRACPETAAEYAALKMELAAKYRTDRVAYTAAKAEFIGRITRMAKKSLSENREGEPECRVLPAKPAAGQ